MRRSLLMALCIVLTFQAQVYGQEAPPVRRIGTAPWRHPGATMVAYTPKGDRLIIGGSGFRGWDNATGKILHDVDAGPIPFGPARQIGLAVVGPEGKQLATVGFTDQTVRLWDLDTGKEIASYKHEKSDPTSIAVSADGKLLALGNWNLEVILFQLPTLKVLHTFHDLPEDQVNQNEQVSRIGNDNWFSPMSTIVSGIAFSPNGKYLAVGATNGSNWVYDVESRKLLHKYRKFSYAGPVAFAPDNTLWIAGYPHAKDPKKKSLDYWSLYQAIDLASGAETHHIKTKGPMYPLVFSQDGKWVGYVPFQWEFAIWSLAEKRCVFHCESLGDPHVGLAFSTDGKTLAVASGGLRMFDTKTWRDPRIAEGHVGAIVAAQFTPDGAHIVTAGYDTTTRLWDAKTGKEINRFDGHIRKIESMSLSGDGKLAATGDSYGWIHLWDLPAKMQIARFKQTDRYDSAYSASFSPDGTQLATTGISLTAHIFDVKTQKLIRSMRGDELESSGQWELCWSPDGKTLAGIGGNYDSLYLWDPARGNLLVADAPVKFRIRALSYSPDAEVLAYWADEKLRILSLKDYKVVREIPNVRSGAIAFSPNGKWLCAGAKLYDYASGKELHDFARDFVAVHFDRASRLLLTVERNQTVAEVWDVKRLIEGSK
jgi:WD40 repeat protein